MAFGVCLVFELASDFHIFKDVIQVPIELAKLLGNCPTYLITRPNACQQNLSEHINVINIGETILENNEAFQKGKMENLIFSLEWYEEACKVAAEYADVLMLFPHFGNYTKGARSFSFRSLSKGRLPTVYLKLDADPRGFLKTSPQHQTKSVIKKLKYKIENLKEWLRYLPITAISAESSYTLEMFSHLHPSLSNKSFLVKNCPPQAEVISLPDRNTLIKHKMPIFLAVGRLDFSGKAIEILLSAWMNIAPQCQNWKLRLVGSCEPNFKKVWMKKFQKANLTDTVEWMGPIYNRNTLWDIYSQSSILLISSRHESGPLVLAEAIVAGCAIISTPVGEVPYVLNSSEHGIFPIDDVEALAKTMLLFATDDTIRRKQLMKLEDEVQHRQWHIQLKPVADKINSSLIRNATNYST